MSSVFAIQIDAFPHDSASGELSWPVELVMGLLCECTLLPLPTYAFQSNPLLLCPGINTVFLTSHQQLESPRWSY
jgi:hypothetical protein